MTTKDISPKTARLENENLRLRSLLAKEIETNRVLRLALDKPHFLTRLFQKFFK